MFILLYCVVTAVGYKLHWQ